jgi:hypothetical protein
MAAAKKAPPPPVKKPAAKASKSTALMPWKEEMAKRAAVAASKEKLTNVFKQVTIEAGQLMIDDQAVDGNSMEVMILATSHENDWFKEKYKRGQKATPHCFAFGDEDAEDIEASMKPHPESEEPQAESCDECPHNQWNSDRDGGKGKDCKNVRRLLLVSADDAVDAATLLEAEQRVLKLPVTSVKNWAHYVNSKLNEELQRPCYGVITKISVVPDAKSQFKVVFSFVNEVDFDQELWDAVTKLNAEGVASMQQPYPKPSSLVADVAPPTNGRGKTAQALRTPPGKTVAKGAKRAKF